MKIRVAGYEDLDGLLTLYAELQNNPIPPSDDRLTSTWKRIIENDMVNIIVADEGETIVSSCTITIIPNLTYGQQPYALVENVITSKGQRRKGLATKCLDFARSIAKKEGCYKIMLLTGVKEPHVTEMYQKAGYNKDDKIGFIQWI